MFISNAKISIFFKINIRARKIILSMKSVQILDLTYLKHSSFHEGVNGN